MLEKYVMTERKFVLLLFRFLYLWCKNVLYNRYTILFEAS